MESDQNQAPGFCFDAFSSREPVSTSLENALGSDLVAGFRQRVVDANLERRKAAFQLDRTAFRAFPGIKFGLDSTIDFKSKAGLWKFVGMKRHVDVPCWHREAMGYRESGFAGKSD